MSEEKPTPDASPAVQADGLSFTQDLPSQRKNRKFVKAYEREFSMTLDEAVANVIFAKRIRRG